MRHQPAMRQKRAVLRAGVAILALALALSMAKADKFKNPTAVFAGLDKITGRIITFEAVVDETVQFGTLQITPKICYSRPVDELQQTTTFLEVEEAMGNNRFRKLFSGWMFAASPGLNAIEHPVYDVWLTECKGARDPQDRIKTPPERDDLDELIDTNTPIAKTPVDPNISAKRTPSDKMPAQLPTEATRRAAPQQRFYPIDSNASTRYEPGPRGN